MFDYHRNNGSITDPIFSHSGYCRLEQHPQEYVKYATQEEKIQTPSMERGDLLHAWLQHKDSFVVSELDKPTASLANFVEKLHELYVLKGYANESRFVEYCKSDYSVDVECMAMYQDIFINIHHKVAVGDELKVLIYVTRFAREEAEFGGKPGNKGAHKEPTVLENLKKGLEYLNFLTNSSGKIIMTKVDKNIVVNCNESLKKHPLANRLLFELDGLVEHEMFWEENIDGILIKRKAKADKIIVDYNNKVLTVIDPKTTSKPVGTFALGDHSPFNLYKYGRQLESYADAWFKTNPEVIRAEWKVQLFSIPVQTTDPFPTIVYKISPLIVHTAIDAMNPTITLHPYTISYNKFQNELDRLNKRAAFHVKTGNWNLTMEEQMNEGYVEI